jgi:hypothetical protein
MGELVAGQTGGGGNQGGAACRKQFAFQLFQKACFAPAADYGYAIFTYKLCQIHNEYIIQYFFADVKWAAQCAPQLRKLGYSRFKSLVLV